MARINFAIDQSEKDALSDRATRLKSNERPHQLTSMESTVLFLRAVSSRATLILPAFYLHLGAGSGESLCIVEGYPGVVLKDSLKINSIGTVALTCRKVFDHGSKGMTGANFAKASDATLCEVASYWSRSSNRPVDDATKALRLLRSVFRDCARAEGTLLSDPATLGRRIALLKQYANRSAAHLSLEPFEFSLFDSAHVVAAIVMIGEIIRSFDKPDSQPGYFDELDKASFSMSEQLFPDTQGKRLFDNMDVEKQSRLYWQWDIELGKQLLMEQLPFAIGWY